jgi:hypothetical protein
MTENQDTGFLKKKLKPKNWLRFNPLPEFGS